MATKTANRKNASGFSIGVGCPGCGGDLWLDTDFFVMTCEHCSSTLRVMMPEIPPAYLASARITPREARFQIDRFLRSHNMPLTGSRLHFKHLYYPYWKIDAVMLKVRNRSESFDIEVEDDPYSDISHEKQKTDISLIPYMTTCRAGIDFEGVPDSIGMRAGYIKLLPYTVANTQEDYDSLEVLKTWPAALDDVRKKINSLNNMEVAAFGSNLTELYRPVASLVYFPYLIVESYTGNDYSRFVVDGVTGRLLNHIEQLSPPDISSEAVAPQLEFGELGIEFHRCPNCGEDLPSEQSLIYICENCQQFINLEANSIPLNVIRTAEGGTDDRLMPFWSLRMPEEEADKLKMLFGGIYRSDRLVIPAFRTTNFEAVFRLSKRMSAAMPQIPTQVAEAFDARYAPVNLSLAEARVLANIAVYRAELGRLAGSRGEMPEFTPTEVELVFAPFHLEHYFYVDSVLESVTFEKNLIR